MAQSHVCTHGIVHVRTYCRAHTKRPLDLRQATQRELKTTQNSLATHSCLKRIVWSFQYSISSSGEFHTASSAALVVILLTLAYEKHVHKSITSKQDTVNH